MSAPADWSAHKEQAPSCHLCHLQSQSAQLSGVPACLRVPLKVVPRATMPRCYTLPGPPSFIWIPRYTAHSCAQLKHDVGIPQMLTHTLTRVKLRARTCTCHERAVVAELCCVRVSCACSGRRAARPRSVAGQHASLPLRHALSVAGPRAPLPFMLPSPPPPSQRRRSRPPAPPLPPAGWQQ